MKYLNHLCLVCTLAISRAASAAPLYNIVPLGLDDLEHTSSVGSQYSLAIQLNESGQVHGFSSRFAVGGGYSVWLYDGATTIHIGLTGSEHTRNNGYKNSSAYELNEAGQVLGRSDRYNGGSTDLGSSAWLYSGATTIDVGLTGAEHTRNNGYKRSDSRGLNEAGQVSGVSYRYNGGSIDLGRSAWFYDGATTIDIGLTGPEYTRGDGYKYSDSNSFYDRLNEAGQVSGVSHRYNGDDTFLGQSAWLYDGATTIDIGLTGAEHTRSNGYKQSDAQQLNEAGQVSGVSDRYNGGSTALGQSAWLYDGATTIDIGLTGAEYTRGDGYKYSDFSSSYDLLNETGQVSGFSARYNGGSTALGQSAWLYNGATTIDIGLTAGVEYTRNDGYRFSVSNKLNEAGQVVGYAARYNGGSTDLGRSTWLYDGATTIDIGLTGPEHTRNDGYKYSEGGLNEAGQVIGSSRRYNGGSTDLGRSVWLYDGATTIDIGLTGSEHTRSDRYKESIAGYRNETGQVVGYSRRYNGNIYVGEDAWLYDPLLDQTFSLQSSVRSSDGYASSAARYLGEDGLVLGSYTLFDALDNQLGNRAFYFTIADGLHDLGPFVDGGLPANGWDYLADAIRANGLGQILGHGKLTSQSSGQMAYLLTPAVPEPNTLLLGALSSLALLRRRRALRCLYAPMGSIQNRH